MTDMYKENKYMIYDSFSNKSSYLITHPLFEKAFEYLENYLKNPVAPGNYEICGKDLYVVVQNYETRDEGLFEAHNQYIDIQCMIKGTEKVYYANRESLELSFDYDENKDVMFYKDSDDCVEFLLRDGDFMVFFPQDAHKPAMAVNGKKGVVKLVFKVKV